MKVLLIVVSIVSALLAIARVEAANTSAPAPKKQTTCPIMGGPINTNLFVDAEGKRVYVCCQGCLPELKQNPGKCIRKLEQQGITLDAAPKPADARK